MTETISYDFNHNMLIFTNIAKFYKKLNTQNRHLPEKNHIGSESYFSFQILISQRIEHIYLEKQWLEGSILGSWPSHFNLSFLLS